MDECEHEWARGIDDYPETECHCKKCGVVGDCPLSDTEFTDVYWPAT